MCLQTPELFRDVTARSLVESYKILQKYAAPVFRLTKLQGVTSSLAQEGNLFFTFHKNTIILYSNQHCPLDASSAYISRLT